MYGFYFLNAWNFCLRVLPEVKVVDTQSKAWRRLSRDVGFEKECGGDFSLDVLNRLT